VPPAEPKTNTPHALLVRVEVAVHYNADILLAGLIRALEANKQPKSKMSILEFSTAFIGHSRTAGIPTASAMHLK